MARVWKRKDRDCWVADYRDENGSRRRLTARTRKEAETLLHDKIQEAREAEKPECANPDITLGEYVETWLEDQEDALETHTTRSYKHLLHGHILPKLGRLKVREIKRSHIKGLLDGKRRDGYLKDGKKLRYARNTLRLMRSSLASVLTDALDDGIIKTNPALQITNRKKKGPAGPVKNEIRPMDWEQLQTFLASSRKNADPRYTVMFELMAKTGLRPSEARALYLDGDIDVQRKTLRVERAFSDTDRIKGTKTNKRREVDLSQDLIPVLEQHRIRIRAEALKLGIADPKWLFPNTVGEPLDKNNVGRVFRRVLKKAKLPHFRPYDLRHTFASMLLARGARLPYVSAQLGHSNPAVTLKYYAHYMPSEGGRYVDMLDHAPGGEPAGGNRALSVAVGSGQEDRSYGMPREVGTNPGTKPVSDGILTEEELQLIEKIGGADGDRTRDLLTASQALSQLSYSPTANKCTRNRSL